MERYTVEAPARYTIEPPEASASPYTIEPPAIAAPDEDEEARTDRGAILPFKSVRGEKRRTEREPRRTEFDPFESGILAPMTEGGKVVLGRRSVESVAPLEAAGMAAVGVGGSVAGRAGRALGAATRAAGSTAEAAGARAAAKVTAEEIVAQAKAKGTPVPTSADAAKMAEDVNQANAEGRGPGAPSLAQPTEGPLTRPPALLEPRTFEDQLFQLHSNAEADKIATLKAVQAAPKLPPETWEKLYAYEENALEPEGKRVTLTPQEQAIYDRHVKPLADADAKLYAELESIGSDLPEAAGIQQPGRPGYTPRYPIGRTRSYGQMLEDWKRGVIARTGGAAGRSMRRTIDAQKSRRFYNAVNSETGERTVVHVGRDGTVLSFDGTAEPKEFGTFARGQKIAPGSKVMSGGVTHVLQDASTRQIEEVAKTRYSKNVLANRLDQHAKLLSAVRNAKFIEAMKDSPEFGQIAVKRGQIPGGVDPDAVMPGRNMTFREYFGEPTTPPKGWRTPKVAQFQNYYMEPHVADALDDFMKTADNPESLARALNKIGRVMNYVMFINPKAHIDNVLNHMLIQGGLAGNIIGAPSLARNLIRATKSVLTADARYIRSLRAGASLPYARMLTADLHTKILEKLGAEAKADPYVWDKIAQSGGYLDAKTMLKRWGQVPQKILWLASDIMTQARTFQLAEKGISLEKAIAETERNMPNYRVPGQILKQRWLAQIFGNPATGRFGRYQFGKIAGPFRLINDALLKWGSGLNVAERAKALDRLTFLALYTFVIYQLYDQAWQAVTGNPRATTGRSGLSGVAQIPLDVYNGDKEVSQVPQSLFTPGVPIELPIELFYNRYLWSGQQIYRDADLRAGRYGQVFRDLGGYIGSETSTVGQLLSPSGKETAGQIGLRALGVKSPTETQVALRKKYKAKEAAAAARRAATQ